jgi:hypothetical protein
MVPYEKCISSTMFSHNSIFGTNLCSYGSHNNQELYMMGTVSVVGLQGNLELFLHQFQHQ